jgi:hypothetical protein
MARTRWPPICETPASCPGQADRTGSAGGCLNDRDPGDGPVSRQPRWGVRPDNRSDQVPAPTLRPHPHKTTEAGPKLSSTSSLPIRNGWPIHFPMAGRRSYRPDLSFTDPPRHGLRVVGGSASGPYANLPAGGEGGRVFRQPPAVPGLGHRPRERPAPKSPAVSGSLATTCLRRSASAARRGR